MISQDDFDLFVCGWFFYVNNIYDTDFVSPVCFEVGRVPCPLYMYWTQNKRSEQKKSTNNNDKKSNFLTSVLYPSDLIINKSMVKI